METSTAEKLVGAAASFKPKRFHHATIPVVDCQQAEDFYVTGLGFTKLPRPELSFGGIWLQLSDLQLHIVVVDEEEMRKMSMGEVTAARHLALEIDDYDAAKQALEAAGLEFRENVAGTNLQIFLRDPAGNVVELIVPDGALKR